MSIYVIPALVALILKLGVYVLAKKGASSSAFLRLLVVFALHNALEFSVMYMLSDGYSSLYLLKFYYVSTLLVFAYFCMFVMSVINDEPHNRFNFLVLALSLTMGAVILFTDMIVAGVTPIGYSVTAVKGSFYFVFQGVILSGFIFAITVLVRRFNQSNDMRVRLKCFYTLFALSPIIFVSVVILIAMQLGVQFNAVALLPLASTCFLLLVVLSEKNHDLINIRQYLLFSNARSAEKRILEVAREHLHNGMDLSQAKLEFEKALVQYALDDSGGNMAWAAERLSVNRSSLYSTLSRLGIKRDDNVTSK